MAERRLVVTGQTTEGRSVFVSDSLVEGIEPTLLPGFEFHRLWGSDETPTLPTDGSPQPAVTYFPPAGGYRFGFFTTPPDSVRSTEDIDFESAFAEFTRILPGLAETLEPDNPGMHTTDTVDVDVVISGEIWLELDDGEEIHLRSGDAVIQNGTRHRWRNRGEEPCVVFVTLLGATRAAPGA